MQLLAWGNERQKIYFLSVCGSEHHGDLVEQKALPHCSQPCDYCSTFPGWSSRETSSPCSWGGERWGSVMLCHPGAASAGQLRKIISGRAKTVRWAMPLKKGIRWCVSERRMPLCQERQRHLRGCGRRARGSPGCSSAGCTAALPQGSHRSRWHAERAWLWRDSLPWIDLVPSLQPQSYGHTAFPVVCACLEGFSTGASSEWVVVPSERGGTAQVLLQDFAEVWDFENTLQGECLYYWCGDITGLHAEHCWH